MSNRMNDKYIFGFTYPVWYFSTGMLRYPNMYVTGVCPS